MIRVNRIRDSNTFMHRAIWRLAKCVTFQILPLFGVTVAGAKTPKSTMNISGPRKRTSIGLLKLSKQLSEPSGFDIMHSKITASVLLGWVMKSLTTPVLRSMRATLNPSPRCLGG